MPWARPILRFALLSPLYAAYGAFILLGLLCRLVAAGGRARRAMARQLKCPSCGTNNSTAGRFVCSSCHAEYHGWVGCCRVCGAGAAWMPCEHCGSGIRFPWFRTR
jgi:hypothetical protein